MKLILLLAILPFCHSNLCPKGEYWSTFSEICLKCTLCKPDQIVIKTCQAHKNTLCYIASKSFNGNNNNDKHINNKNTHHFEKGKLHFISDEGTDEVIENALNSPLLDLEFKHFNTHKYHRNGSNKKNNPKKQRINDKFLKWDDIDVDNYDDDYDYNVNKHKKHLNHKSTKTDFFELHHHYKFTDSSEESNEKDDITHNNLGAILDKNSKNTWNSKKWKDDLISEHKKQKNKKAARLAKLEDERKLEEWLIQSRKQFKDRKDNLLKTLKEEQLDSYENDKRIRLNYPLLSAKDGIVDFEQNDTKKNYKSESQRKHNVQSEVELFKELIKNEESQEMELATLMSNKKESPFHYKTVTPAHRMFLGEPSSSLADITAGHIKDPQEVIKEEMGRNIIFEKSKFSVVPLVKNGNGEERMPVEFTAAERLVWDWQAVAVVSAIAACLLFFLVIGIFILVNARQWKREKHPFHIESEELSTRVALIQPTLESSAAEGSNTNKFLQYLLSNEDILKDRKDREEDIKKS